MKLALALAIILLWGVWGFLYKIGVAKLGPWKALLWGTVAYGLSELAVLAYLLNRGADFSFGSGSAAIMLGSFSAVAASIVFLFALEKYQASIIVPLTALYPAVTVVLGILVLGEQIKPENALGVALAIAAGYLLAK